MGNNLHNKGFRVHVVNKPYIPYINILLHHFYDILDQQIQLLETKGALILIPILGVEAFLFAIFADISGISSTAEVIKNIILSLIGLSMGVMGVINTFIGMKRRIRKYKEEEAQAKKNKVA